MHPLRTVRRSRGLTITDLALLSGIPARSLGEAEYGIVPLAPQIASQLALVLGVPATALTLPSLAPQRPGMLDWRPAAAIAAISAVLLATPPLTRLPTLPIPSAATAPVSVLQAALVAPQRDPADARPTVALGATATVAPPPPTSIPTVAVLAASVPAQPSAEPRACPLLAAPERVVITQGYGVGTHAPARNAGAVDLGIDADGDGVPEPDATAGVIVLATHTGVAQVYPDSWPGGNVVRIVDTASGWSTLYAHLGMIAIADGAQVNSGTPIGVVGTTGLSSGPHLHYEIRHGDANIDPAGFAACWRLP